MCRWLAVIVRHDLVYPLSSNVTPSALHRISLKRKMRKKNSHPNPGGVFTLASFRAHAPVGALCVSIGGPFFVSIHVDDPTTGLGTLGEVGLTLTARGRQRGLLEVCLRVGRGTSVWLGRVCGLGWGLVEV